MFSFKFYLSFLFVVLFILVLNELDVLVISDFILFKFFVIVFYFILIVDAFVNYSVFSLYSLFLITFGVFILSSIILSVFCISEFNVFDSFVYVRFPDSVILNSLLYILFFLSLFSFVYKYVGHHEFREVKITYNERLMNYSIVIMNVAIPFVIFRSYMELLFIKQNGYLSMFNGELSNIEMNVFLKLSYTVYNIGFMFFVASKPLRNKFNIYASLYVLLALMYSLKGARVGFVVALLFVVWYLCSIYNAKIKIGKLILAFISIVVLLQIFAIVRLGEDVNMSFLSLFFTFFISQANSYNVILLTLQNKEMLSNLKYQPIYDPLVYLYNYFTNPDITTMGQSYESLNYRMDLGHQLTSNLNMNAYLSGNSIGSSFLAELILLGLPLFVIFVVIFALLLKYVNNKIFKNRALLLYSLPIISHVLIMSRNNYFMSLYDIFKITLLIVFFYIIYLIKRPRIVVLFNKKSIFHV